MKRLEFEYYNWSEFETFLNQLPSKDAAKLYATINNIEINGLEIAQRQKWVKKLEANLFEIRSRQASNIQRALYFHWENNHYIITHGFAKKSQRTPISEIRRGRRRRQEFERSHNHEQN